MASNKYANLGMDTTQSQKYAKNMEGIESEEDIDRDIVGLRKKQPLFSAKSYDKLKKDLDKQYEDLEKHNKLVSKIPKVNRGYTEHR